MESQDLDGKEVYVLSDSPAELWIADPGVELWIDLHDDVALMAGSSEGIREMRSTARGDQPAISDDHILFEHIRRLDEGIVAGAVAHDDLSVYADAELRAASFSIQIGEDIDVFAWVEAEDEAAREEIVDEFEQIIAGDTPDTFQLLSPIVRDIAESVDGRVDGREAYLSFTFSSFVVEELVGIMVMMAMMQGMMP